MLCCSCLIFYLYNMCCIVAALYSIFSLLCCRPGPVTTSYSDSVFITCMCCVVGLVCCYPLFCILSLWHICFVYSVFCLYNMYVLCCRSGPVATLYCVFCLYMYVLCCRSGLLLPSILYFVLITCMCCVVGLVCCYPLFCILS